MLIASAYLNTISFAESPPLVLPPLVNNVTLDGIINEDEWSDAEIIKQGSPNGKGDFVVLYKYDVNLNVLYIAMSSPDDTPVADDTFAIDIDFAGDNDGKINSNDYQITITRFYTMIWHYDDEGQPAFVDPIDGMLPFGYKQGLHSSPENHSLEVGLNFTKLPDNQNIRFVYGDAECEACNLTLAEFGKQGNPDTWHNLSYAEVPEFLHVMLIFGITFMSFLVFTSLKKNSGLFLRLT